MICFFVVTLLKWNIWMHYLVICLSDEWSMWFKLSQLVKLTTNMLEYTCVVCFGFAIIALFFWLFIWYIKFVYFGTASKTGKSLLFLLTLLSLFFSSLFSSSSLKNVKMGSSSFFSTVLFVEGFELPILF